MRLKDSIIAWFKKHARLLKLISYLFNGIALLALLSWLFKQELTIQGYEIDYEALFTLLTTAAILINQLYKWLLSEAEYSPSQALALGYVNNFLEPVITQLIEKDRRLQDRLDRL